MLLPVRRLHYGRDRCALSMPKQVQNSLLLRLATWLGCDRFLCGSPRLHLADGGRLRFSLCLDHFGLLSWIVTAHWPPPPQPRGDQVALAGEGARFRRDDLY